jgi:hypothetical protein
MARKPKKYHYIYKTTCRITGKFYVGMHSSDSLDDGYLGSGKILGYSRKKYGDENHVREILEHCSSRDELKQREKEIVCEALVADPLNINLKYGGEGGGRIWNEAHAQKLHRAGWEAMQRNVDASARSKRTGETISRRVKSGELKVIGGFTNKKHSTQTKIQMSASKRQLFIGEGNPNFGKRNACIVKDGVRKRISLDLLQSFLDDGWSRGMK